jgi:hypothetical protein
MASKLTSLLDKLSGRLRMGKGAAAPRVIPLRAAQPDADKSPAQNALAGTRYLLGGLGESRQMYALDDNWQVQSHRKLDPATAQGTVVAADPALDLARRIDHTVSERVQLAEFASDIGEPLLTVKTKARSGLAQMFSGKARTASDQEEGETLSATQAIQQRGWWLCTPANRLQGLAPSVRVLPLASVMLKMLEAHSQAHAQEMDGAATVVALVFPGAQPVQVEDYQIVCLATFTAAGHFEGLDFVPGSGMSVAQVIGNYVALRRLNPEGLWPQERLVLATTADPQIQKWLSAAAAYPRQTLILGMPVKTAARLSTILSASALLTTASYSAWAHWQLSQMRTDISQGHVAQQQARTQAIAAVRERSLGYVLSHSGLDTQRAIDLAVQAWQPGTLVEMQASTDRITLTVSAALGQSDTGSAGASLVNAAPPAGCTASPTQVNANMNQLVITYECSLQNPELERMRAAGF